MGVGSNPTSDKIFFLQFLLLLIAPRYHAILFGLIVMVAEWRSGSVLGP